MTSKSEDSDDDDIDIAICHKQTFYLVFDILFRMENDVLTSTFFAFFE